MSSVCDRFDARVSRFLARGLDAEERRALREHQAVCATCREGYRGAVEAAAALGGMRRAERDLVARTLRRERMRPTRLATAAADSGRARRGRGLRPLVYPALLAALLVSLARVEGPGGARLVPEVGRVVAGVRTLEEAAPLRQGEIVHTGADGRARLRGHAGEATLAPSSRVLVERTRRLRLRLLAGEVVVVGPAVVCTTGGVLELAGEGRARVSFTSARLRVAVESGTGRVATPTETRALAAGETWP